MHGVNEKKNLNLPQWSVIRSLGNSVLRPRNRRFILGHSLWSGGHSVVERCPCGVGGGHIRAVRSKTSR